VCKVRARWWLAGCKLSVCAVHRGAIAPEGCLAERPPRGLGWCGWPDGLPPAAVPVGVVWAVPLSGALGCRVRFSGLPRGAEGGVGCGEFCLLWPHRWRLRELHEHGLTTVLSCPCAPSHYLQSCPPTLVVGFFVRLFCFFKEFFLAQAQQPSPLRGAACSRCTSGLSPKARGQANYERHSVHTRRGIVSRGALPGNRQGPRVLALVSAFVQGWSGSGRRGWRSTERGWMSSRAASAQSSS